MTDRARLGLAAGGALLAGSVLLAGCGSPTRVDAATGPALGTPTPTVSPPGGTPAPTTTGRPGTGGSPTPSASSRSPRPSATETAQLRRLVRARIVAGDRSLSVLRPAAWTPTRAQTEATRNRTFYQDDDHQFLVIVEISPATTTDPYAAALTFASNRQSSLKNDYAAIGLGRGPDAGAHVEYTYTDPASGVRRHAVDWFATVGATDVALFAAGPTDDWDSVDRLWQRMVDSVEPGPLPPGYTGPGAATASPSESPSPPDPTPTDPGRTDPAQTDPAQTDPAPPASPDTTGAPSGPA